MLNAIVKRILREHRKRNKRTHFLQLNFAHNLNVFKYFSLYVENADIFKKKYKNTKDIYKKMKRPNNLNFDSWKQIYPYDNL